MIEGADIDALPDRPTEQPVAERGPRPGRVGQLMRSPDARAVAVIAGAVVLANLLYLLGIFDPNPLDFRSGLTNSVTPGLLGGRPVIDPSGGLIVQATGHLAALDVLHLRLPWWNPYEGTGMPLLGETESAALFPPTWLLALSDGQLFERVLLELIAGVCTYRLLLRLCIVRPAAVAGAIAFALNGKFAWFIDATVNPLPFLPMMLLGVERAYVAARDGRSAGWRLLALSGALSVYGGFPEVAYIDALMGFCWVAWRLDCLERARRRAFMVKATLGALGGTLLAAPVLVAMGTYLTHADLGIHTGGGVGAVRLGVSALPQLLLPYVFGQVDGNPHATIWLLAGGYLSTTLLLFAGLGLVSRGRRSFKILLVGWALVVFARMYGQPPLLDRVIGVAPGMSSIEFYRYGSGVLELTVILLAAVGIDDVVRFPAHRSRLLWAALAAFAAVGAASVLARSGADPAHGAYFAASLAWGAAVIAGAATAALVRRPRLRAGVLVAVVALDALALYVVPEFAAPRAVSVDHAPVAYLRTHLGGSRFFTLGPIAPNYGSYFGLASLGVDDFPPQAYADYARRHLDPWIPIATFRARGHRSPTWELLHHLGGYRAAGVRYVLTPSQSSLPQSPTTLQLVFRSRSSRIYRLAGAAPYFSAAGCVATSTAGDSARLDCRRGAVLIRRETWFAGWTADIDGHPAVIRRSDGLFQAVVVPAGVHRVTFSFAPPGMLWALLAFLSGCALMGTPVLRRLRR